MNGQIRKYRVEHFHKMNLKLYNLIAVTPVFQHSIMQ